MTNTYTSENKREVIKRAFSEFLLLPSAIILLFVCLAYFTYSIDHAKINWLQPVRAVLKSHIFSSAQATSSLLGAIVSGVISVTTLTTTLLLVIVQQSASSITAQVFDQFLRRKTNQFYLGFFVGLALYSMVTLATVNDPFNPVLGGTVAFSLTGVALYLLVLLVYTTIDQMRPSEIINAIHNRILAARSRQVAMLAFTTQEVPDDQQSSQAIRSAKGGYLNYINTKHLSTFIHNSCRGSRVIFTRSIGSYVAYQEVFAQIIYAEENHIKLLTEELLTHTTIGAKRDLDHDTTYGIQQLETISWTSTSTAKSNPSPGILCVHTLHNLVSCWSQEQPAEKKENASALFYTDNTIEELMRSFENLAVVSSESMQHQVFEAILTTFSATIARVPVSWQQRIEQVLLVMLSVMGDHVLTTALENALETIIHQLYSLQKVKTARAVEEALQQLKASVGQLNSRSTRV